MYNAKIFIIGLVIGIIIGVILTGIGINYYFKGTVDEYNRQITEYRATITRTQNAITTIRNENNRVRNELDTIRNELINSKRISAELKQLIVSSANRLDDSTTELRRIIEEMESESNYSAE